MISCSASAIATASDSVVFTDVTKGNDGLGGVSSSIRYRLAATARNFLKSPQVTLSIEQISILPLSRRSRLATCPPVMTTEEKKGLPPAIRASDSRGRFIPELDNKLLQPNIPPRRSSSRSAGSPARTMKKARWVDPTHPGVA